VHVTQHDEADITDLEGFRKSESEQAKKRNVHLTVLPFIMKAVVATLKAFPTFNASLDPTGENLILKRYFHLGVAVDTPEGLVVPVIRDVDRKGVYDLAPSSPGQRERRARTSFCPATCRAEASPSPAWVASAAPPSRPS
jgi:pyruvate dehydrogenase E2 component (dihydrolipoamide acetyltransferase)